MLSFVEIARDQRDVQAMVTRVVSLTADMPRETALDIRILLYRSRALVLFGLKDAAQFHNILASLRWRRARRVLT